MCILRGRFLNENFHFIVLVNTCFMIYLQFIFFSYFITLARKILEIFCSLWAISFFSTPANFLERKPQEKTCTFYVICYFLYIRKYLYTFRISNVSSWFTLLSREHSTLDINCLLNVENYLYIFCYSEVVLIKNTVIFWCFWHISHYVVHWCAFWWT